jgi:hypothetical protein
MPKYVTYTWCKMQRCENYYTDTDRGVWSWPWQFVWLEKAASPFSVTSNRRIPFKNTSGRRAVVSCACEIIKFLGVAFCVVRAVHKFDFRLTKSEGTNKWRWVEGTSWSDKDSYFWHELYVFFTTFVASVKRLYPRCAGQSRTFWVRDSSFM